MSAVSLINRFGQQTRIERPSLATDTGGGQDKGAPSWPLVTIETVWIQPTSADQSRVMGGDFHSVTHDGFVRAGAPIRNGDELVQSGQRYKMLGHFAAGNLSTGSVAHRVLALEYIEGLT